METLRALNKEAKKQNKIHKVILMYELGHIREGASREEILELAEECTKLENIELYGFGTNPSCYSATMPITEEMEEFVNLVEETEKKYNIKIEILSGGNSTSYENLKNKELPTRINELRMGELIFFGVIPCVGKEVKGLNQNNFILKTEIVEIKDKPSVPEAKIIGVDSYGDIPDEIEDRGIRTKALIAIGKQDVDTKKLECTDKDIINLGASSDYIILDITDSKIKYKVGDIISFKLSYAAVLQVMTSSYVEKEVI